MYMIIILMNLGLKLLLYLGFNGFNFKNIPSDIWICISNIYILVSLCVKVFLSQKWEQEEIAVHTL